MYARRTVVAVLGYGGIAGCLLVGATSAVAAPNPSGFHVLSSKSTGVKTGQYIQASVHSAYNHGTMGNQRIYTRQMVPVAASTLRAGAISALSRGVVHPGFQLALFAAGFVWSQQYGIYEDGTLIEHHPDDFSQYDSYTQVPNVPISCNVGVGSIGGWGKRASPYASIGYTIKLYDHESTSEHYHQSNCTSDGISGTSSYYVPVITRSEWEQDKESPITEPIVSDPVFIDEARYGEIDPHIPPQLYDELYSGGPIPEWQDEITVLGTPATWVMPTGDQAIAPEVAKAVGQWGENVAAQLDGEPLPNPDAVAGGASSSDSLYEELGLGDPVPPFPDLDVEWQTEELDLPAYDSGVGPGQCPAPVSIPLPIGGDTFGWSYEPACDLAETIKPAFLGMCGFIALLIVLRARGGGD